MRFCATQAFCLCRDIMTMTLLMMQDGAPAEEDLPSWGQHSSTDTVPDRVMQSIGIDLPEQVSFIFACKVLLLHPADCRHRSWHALIQRGIQPALQAGSSERALLVTECYKGMRGLRRWPARP